MSRTTAPKQQCVYGYAGAFNDAIKPLLLVYLIGSAFGSAFLAVLFEDATRPFVLLTTLHLLPEVVLWTNLIFPPLTTEANRAAMWMIRRLYIVGLLVLCFGPLNNETGKVGPFVTGTYLIMAGISDTLGVWLGLLMMTRRTHHGVRRIGASFFVHGSAFHLTAYEAFCKGGDAFGVPFLAGFGWIVLLLASVTAFLTLVPLFSEPLDLREQAPSTTEKWFLVGGVLTSLLTIPPLASGGIPDVSEFLANPAFLPRDPLLLTAYKVVFPVLSMVVCIRVLVAYIDAGLPILPITQKTNAEPNVNGKDKN